MNLKDLMVDTKSAWVPFPGYKDFEVEIANLSRKEVIKLRKDCIITKFDRKTRVPLEVLDEEKFVEKFTEATIKNWRGLKLKYLEEIILMDMKTLDKESELPYSTENAEQLVSNSTVFDEWLNSEVFNLDNFRTRAEAIPVSKAGAVAK